MVKLFIGKHDDFSSSDTVKCPLIYSKIKPTLNSFWTCKLSKFGLNYFLYLLILISVLFLIQEQML